MYFDLLIGIVVTTEIIKNLFHTRKYFASKWLMLPIAILGAVSKYIFTEQRDIFMTISSIGASALCYDYLVAVFKDIFIRKKNPLV